MPIRLPVFIAVLVLLIAACAPPPQLRNEAYFNDTSLITGEPCFAPCWHNLIPGETTWEEATTVLSDDDDVTNLDRVRNRETGEEVYNFQYQNGPQCCRIYSRDGSTLASTLLLLKPEMTVGDVVEHYGVPQYVQGNDVTADQTFVTLVFPDVPMLVYAFASGMADGRISADSEVIGAVYMAPSEMTTFLGTTALFVWDGYGTLQSILTGEAVIPQPDSGAGTAESSDENG